MKKVLIPSNIPSQHEVAWKSVQAALDEANKRIDGIKTSSSSSPASTVTNNTTVTNTIEQSYSRYFLLMGA